MDKYGQEIRFHCQTKDSSPLTDALVTNYYHAGHFRSISSKTKKIWRFKGFNVSLEAGTLEPHNSATGGHRDLKIFSCSYII